MCRRKQIFVLSFHVRKGPRDLLQIKGRTKFTSNIKVKHHRSGSILTSIHYESESMRETI